MSDTPASDTPATRASILRASIRYLVADYRIALKDKRDDYAAACRQLINDIYHARHRCVISPLGWPVVPDEVVPEVEE